ncbi:MAG TPA: hypothetical protein VM095_03765 [Pyrinomonadaceae bacterium]|nr:hypothetical protein [Pyrinomonadaceae bacterium]
MKVVTTKMILSLVGILLIAPFFAVALIVGGRVAALSHGAQDDLLLVALVLGGAAAGIFNGLGRRATKDERMDTHHVGVKSRANQRSSFIIHLGY